MGLEEQVFAQAARIRELEGEIINLCRKNGLLQKTIDQLKFAGVDKPHVPQYQEFWSGGFPLDEDS